MLDTIADGNWGPPLKTGLKDLCPLEMDLSNIL